MPKQVLYFFLRNILGVSVSAIHFVGSGPSSFTVSKIECSKQAYALNILAWNNKIGLWSILLVYFPK